MPRVPPWHLLLARSLKFRERVRFVLFLKQLTSSFTVFYSERSGLHPSEAGGERGAGLSEQPSQSSEAVVGGRRATGREGLGCVLPSEVGAVVGDVEASTPELRKKPW